jgi:hypothetical protein
MSKKNSAPTDQDVASIIASLGGPVSETTAPVDSPPADEESDGSLAADTPPDDSEYLSAAELSPAAEAAIDAAVVTAAEDDRPIQVNLPARVDPTTVVVGTGDIAKPLVEPTILGKVVPNRPAFDNDGNPLPVGPGQVQPASIIPTLDPNVAAQIQAHARPKSAAEVIHEVTPIEQDPHAPTEEQRQVLTEYGVTAWFNPAENYWTIRQGPRVGAIPNNASIDEWKSRCGAISVIPRLLRQ